MGFSRQKYWSVLPFPSSGDLLDPAIEPGSPALQADDLPTELFNFMAAVTICSDFGAPKNRVCHYFHYFPIFCHEMMGPDAMILVFWMLSFKPTFHSLLSLLSRGFLILVFCHKCGFIYIFEVIDISPSNLESALFLMMYSAY